MAEEINKDLALETLLEVAKKIAPELPDSLLTEVYAIQHSHQFNKDRDVSFQEMQRILDRYIDTLTLREAR